MARRIKPNETTDSEQQVLSSERISTKLTLSHLEGLGDDDIHKSLAVFAVFQHQSD